MQFCMSFQTKGLTLPLACQYQVQSMVYSLLAQNEQFGRQIHPDTSSGERQMVPFCLGPLTGPKTVNRARKQLFYAHQVGLELRTVDAAVTETLWNLLQPGIELTLCGQQIRLLQTEVFQSVIHVDSCQIRMRSPVLAFSRTEDRKTVFYNPLDEQFEQIIRENYERKAVRAGKHPGRLSVVPLSVGRQDKVVTQYKGTWMTGWKGIYRLQGEADALTFLYDAGLGQRNAAGFGMFDVIDHTSGKR